MLFTVEILILAKVPVNSLYTGPISVDTTQSDFVCI